MKLIVLYSVLLFAIEVYSETQVFPWPGPVTAPPDAPYIPEGDSVIIQLASNTTVRELRIRQNAVVTLDCTPRLNLTKELLQRLNLPLDTIQVNWYAHFFDFRGMLSGAERAVTGDNIGEITYSITGMYGEFLGINGSLVPTSAKQGGTAIYRCEVCYNNSNDNCNSSSLYNNVIGDTPVVIVGENVTTDGNSLRAVIGANFCVYRGDGFTTYFITCSHNASFPQNPTPVANYYRNGQLIDTGNSNDYMTSNNPTLVGLRNTFIIFDDFDGVPDHLLGNFTCELSTLYGSSSATTIITECCFAPDSPNILPGTGFIATPNENEIQIGASTCLVTDLKISCTLNTTINATRITWKRNGVHNSMLDGLTSITVSSTGTYTCCAVNRCGNDSASSIILDIPQIDTGSGLATGDNIKIGQSACLGAGGSINIACQLLNEQSSSTVRWTSLADPSVTIGTDPILTVSNSGRYQCNVMNGCGTDSAISTILSTPTVDISGSITGAGGCSNLKAPPVGVELCPYIGDSLQLSCTPATALLQSTSTNSLNILSVSTLNNRTYTCLSTTSNECGVSFSSLMVQVFDPARISRTSTLPPPQSSTNIVIGVDRSSSITTVMNGRTVELHCPYSGIETPETRWFKVDGPTSIPISTGNPPGYTVTDSTNNLILQINSFNSAFAGTFLCNTSNNAGDDQGSSTIAVATPNAEWRTSPWTECSKPCGGGMRNRTVTCVDPSNNGIVDESRCVGEMPSPVGLCNTHPCCDKDIFPPFCKLITGTSRCQSDEFKRACCCTCST